MPRKKRIGPKEETTLNKFKLQDGSWNHACTRDDYKEIAAGVLKKGLTEDKDIQAFFVNCLEVAGKRGTMVSLKKHMEDVQNAVVQASDDGIKFNEDVLLSEITDELSDELVVA